MRRILIIFLITFFPNKVLSETADVSGFMSNLIPGEGITEASIQINEDDNPDLEILAVRDISSGEMSNLFSQFSFHTQEVNNNDRLITNLGIGYRFLNDDKSSMMGINSFIDYDLEGHARGSIGVEAKGAMLDLTANNYFGLSRMQVVDGTEEKVMKGYEINLASQIPYMPWSKINWQSYFWFKEKASTDTKGNLVSLEMMINPTLQFDIIGDYSDDSSVDDEYSYRLSFLYPPRENKITLEDGFISNVAFEKENMEAKLKDKVRRSNNLTVEIQGSVIVTSK